MAGLPRPLLLLEREDERDDDLEVRLDDFEVLLLEGRENDFVEDLKLGVDARRGVETELLDDDRRTEGVVRARDGTRLREGVGALTGLDDERDGVNDERVRVEREGALLLRDGATVEREGALLARDGVNTERGAVRTGARVRLDAPTSGVDCGATRPRRSRSSFTIGARGDGRRIVPRSIERERPLCAGWRSAGDGERDFTTGVWAFVTERARPSPAGRARAPLPLAGRARVAFAGAG